VAQIQDFFIICNIEKLKDVEFIVGVVYVNGEPKSDFITPYKRTRHEIIDKLQDVAVMYGQAKFELWTSSKEVYMQTVEEPFIYSRFKHESDTAITKRYIKDNKDVLLDIYSDLFPEPEEDSEAPKPTPPKWRFFIVRQLEKLTNKLKGEFDFG